jgi:FkbM family methyltransferase
MISKLLQILYFYLIPKPVKCIIRKSISVYCHNNITGYYFFLESLGLKKYEQNAQSFISHFAFSGSFIDIGANEGYYSLLFAKASLKNSARVFAFEPHVDNYKKLSENIILNNLTRKIKSFNVALGNTDTTSTIFMMSSKYGSQASLLKRHKFKKFSEINIKPLDSYSHYFTTKISIIKIDTEGFELDVLKGAKQIIQQHKPVLFIELESSRQIRGQIDVEKICSLLKKMNYILFTHVSDKNFSIFHEAKESNHNLIALYKNN